MRVLIGLLVSLCTVSTAFADTVSNDPAPYFLHFIDSNGPESTNYHVVVGVKPANPLVSYAAGCSDAPESEWAQSIPARTVTLDSGFIELSTKGTVQVDIWDTPKSIGEICSLVASGIFQPRWRGTLDIESYDNNLTFETGRRNGYGFIGHGTGKDMITGEGVSFDIRVHNVASPPQLNKAQDSQYEEVVIKPLPKKK